MSAVVATSPAYAKTSLVLNENVPAENLQTIPLGIVDYYDTNFKSDSGLKILERFGLNKANPFILSLGVLRYYKGLHTLIAAANAIQGTIVIAGSGPEEQSLKSMTAELGVTNVVFAGQISQDEKVVLLQYCRALALPSHVRSEAFGMVLVEASMFSKPMVCCEVGSGTSFVNAHAETGFVIPPESPVDLAAACNQLLADEQLALKMGRNARLRYEKLFSGDALGRAYFSLYQEVSNLDIGHSTQ
jgi:rhamnosyl/mannosyltransferase